MMSSEPTIYMDFSRHSLSIAQACDWITNEWVEGGNSCHATTLDLVKALKWQQAEIERLRRERDEARDEKSRRIYFQDLAYHACNVADAVLGGTTVTGTVDTPDNDFKARLDGVKAEIERLRAERDDARAALRKYLAGDFDWLEVTEICKENVIWVCDCAWLEGDDE